MISIIIDEENGDVVPDGKVDTYINIIREVSKTNVDMTFRIGSELIFNGLRAAIKVEEIDIYNIRFYYDDYEVLVDSYGRVPYWPEPMFVHSNKFLSILL